RFPTESISNKEIARRKINCPNELAKHALIEAQHNEKFNREIVRTQSNLSLCRMWSNHRATVLISLVDQEVKRRGVNCMAYEELAQQQANIAQQQANQEQMIQMQEDAARRQALWQVGTTLLTPPP